MFKNLSPKALGVSGRQSELIELAMTFGFRGLDLDMADFLKRVRTSSLDQARRFLDSAKIEIGGFEFPVDWQGDDASFEKNRPQIAHVAEICGEIGARRCCITILPASDELPYHENFERVRARLTEIAEVFQQHDVSIGLTFLAAAKHRKDHDYQFIHQAEALLTLLKTLNAKNLGLALDTWNWRVGGGDIDQLDELTGDRIVLVRLADAPLDVDWNELTDENRVLPGKGGLVDNAAILRKLAEKEYKGPVTVYPHSRRLVGMTRDAIVQRAAQVLDELWGAAGITRSGKLAPPAPETEAEAESESETEAEATS